MGWSDMTDWCDWCVDFYSDSALNVPYAFQFRLSWNVKCTNASQYGEYILIHISTSLKVCQKRDTKGLYKKSKEGLIKGLTGVDDPYESPNNADIVIDTDGISVISAVSTILAYLKNNKLIK